MKENLMKAIEQLEKIQDDFDIIELAMYLYGRYGKSTIENLSEEELKEIQDKIFGEETLFNQNINDFMEINFDL